MKVLIQGAGIAGLTLARELQQHGIDFLVVEKSPVLKPVGAGITLATNALKCLKHTMDISALRNKGQSLELMYLRDDADEVLSTLPTRLPDDEFHGMALHRHQLHEALLEGIAPGNIRLGVSVKEFESQEHHVSAVLSDGSTLKADYLVGADGLRSEIRDYVDPDAKLEFSGYTCWRATVRHRLPDPTRSVEAWGRGKRLGYIQISPDQLYIYVTLNVSKREYLNGNTQRSNAQLHKIFADFRGESAAIVDLLCGCESLIHNDLEEITLKRWSKGRVVLIGDAAHAMTPNLGQGAAMSIEDAFVLARLWSEDAGTGSLKRYESMRRPRVEFMQKESRKTGRIGQWSSPLAVWFRRGLVKNIPEFIHDHLHRKIFGGVA